MMYYQILLKTYVVYLISKICTSRLIIVVKVKFICCKAKDMEEQMMLQVIMSL